MEQRKGVVFKKKSWISGGVGHFWALDQHDKWKYKHGLCLHIGVEPFSGLILWIEDYGRPIPQVVDFPSTGHLIRPSESGGPAVVTPAMRLASDPPVRPSGPYNANHPHLKDDIARWASGKPGAGSSASNTGYQAPILVSHYAALPRVKNNQRETDIAVGSICVVDSA